MARQNLGVIHVPLQSLSRLVGIYKELRELIGLWCDFIIKIEAQLNAL